MVRCGQPRSEFTNFQSWQQNRESQSARDTGSQKREERWAGGCKKMSEQDGVVAVAGEERSAPRASRKKIVLTAAVETGRAFCQHLRISSFHHLFLP